MQRSCRFTTGCIIGFFFFLHMMPAISAEPAAEARAKLLTQMRSLATATNITYKNGQKAELITEPVFRYDDQQRRFVDATLWCWTHAGRPVAFQKIEAMIHIDTNQAHWQYCWTSLADQAIDVEWVTGKKFAATAPGLALKPLKTDTPPAETAPGRKRQLRNLARDFAARILINPRTNETAEMRLLPTPLFEFNEPNSTMPCGAVFGYSSNGTNPDLIVLIEITGEKAKSWSVSPVRMTTGGLKLRYRDELVWEAEFVEPFARPFPNWTFFQTPRSTDE
jgi:hypothetical protein